MLSAIATIHANTFKQLVFLFRKSRELTHLFLPAHSFMTIETPWSAMRTTFLDFSWLAPVPQWLPTEYLISSISVEPV